LQQSGEDFPALLEELRTYLGPEKPGQLVKAIPGQGSNVPITLLGSSGFSAQLAGMQGLPFAFAAHFAPDTSMRRLSSTASTFGQARNCGSHT
jgi:alkanesulfonate monooxygenase SsuD/methylene tetrahydromethanopterin reductase-like flavin-dependent oxidoreductase (luciferase family)